MNKYIIVLKPTFLNAIVDIIADKVEVSNNGDLMFGRHIVEGNENSRIDIYTIYARGNWVYCLKKD